MLAFDAALAELEPDARELLGRERLEQLRVLDRDLGRAVALDGVYRRRRVEVPMRTITDDRSAQQREEPNGTR
jgi:hypothetical protein